MTLVLINLLGVSHPNTPKKKAETEKRKSGAAGVKSRCT